LLRTLASRRWSRQSAGMHFQVLDEPVMAIWLHLGRES
jgi:hypothetical protein